MAAHFLPPDDALIERYLGSRYLGRRFLRYRELEELGLVDNRGSLKNWMNAGAFPRGIKIPGPHGKTLVWMTMEIVSLIAQRVAEAHEDDNDWLMEPPDPRDAGRGF
jgi:predicted DNA-binding transcriptional regulator AlpA